VSSVHLRSGLVPLALLFCILPFHAQSVSGEGQAPAATFKAETRAVDLDVVVLDGRGEPVKGLRKEDFVIAEDGSPQTVTFFEEHPTATSQADIAANVLLIDTLNTPKEDLGFARKRVADYLKEIPAGTSLAVFSLGQTLRMVQGFTTDRALLLAAVNDKKAGAWSESSAAGVKANQATRDGNALAADIEKLPAPIHVINSAQGLDGLMLRFGRSVDALTQMTKYEATKPGRKLMIWVGEGWPILSSARYHMDTRNKSSFFHSIVDLSTGLREARVTLYGVIPQDMDKGTEARAFLYQNFTKGVESAKQADAGNLSLQVLAEQSGGRLWVLRGTSTATSCGVLRTPMRTTNSRSTPRLPAEWTCITASR
jgi:VWFA-related protein